MDGSCKFMDRSPLPWSFNSSVSCHVFISSITSSDLSAGRDPVGWSAVSIMQVNQVLLVDLYPGKGASITASVSLLGNLIPRGIAHLVIFLIPPFLLRRAVTVTEQSRKLSLSSPPEPCLQQFPILVPVSSRSSGDRRSRTIEERNWSRMDYGACAELRLRYPRC